MKNYTFWLRAAAVTQAVTALVHSISFFVKPEPTNDTERQLFDLLQNYRFDLGGGFHRAMDDLMTGLSMCLTLLFLFACLVSFYLLQKRVAADVMKGIVNINLIVFGFCFAWMIVFTFLPPIILSGLVFVFLLAARFAIRQETL
jgi:hypothetical protein